MVKEGDRKKASFSVRKIAAEDPEDRKDFLLNKLRIFGETVNQKQAFSSNKQPIIKNVSSSAQTVLTLKALKEAFNSSFS